MNKRLITWQEVFDRLKKYDSILNTIYGIPKGGMILTAFLKHAHVTHDPGEATMFLDDVYDSGATFDYYDKKYSATPFYVLFDKRVAEFKNQWLVFPWEAQHPFEGDNVQQNIIRQLQYIGEDINREGLVETPNRIVNSWGEIYSGYGKDPKELLTVFNDSNNYDQIVLLKDIELYSMCEHHMLPFFGKAHVAYIPKDGRVIGISKLARLVDMYARRLQIQERIGAQVVDALMTHLKPLGAACIIEANHMCMRMRGVSKQQSTMITSSLRGVFMDKIEAREELMQLIKG